MSVCSCVVIIEGSNAHLGGDVYHLPLNRIVIIVSFMGSCAVIVTDSRSTLGLYTRIRSLIYLLNKVKDEFDCLDYYFSFKISLGIVPLSLLLIL